MNKRDVFKFAAGFCNAIEKPIYFAMFAYFVSIGSSIQLFAGSLDDIIRFAIVGFMLFISFIILTIAKTKVAFVNAGSSSQNKLLLIQFSPKKPPSCEEWRIGSDDGLSSSFTPTSPKKDETYLVYSHKGQVVYESE